MSKRFLKAEVLDQVDQGVQAGRGEDARALFENLAVSDAGDGGQNHVAPVGQRLGSVVEMRASKNKRGKQKRAGAGSKSLCDRVLDQAAE